MLATLSLLGVGSEAAIPILGYRLLNFWLPIPLAVVFYPTLLRNGRVRDPRG
jgi:glycosyltransferase 2 family protein